MKKLIFGCGYLGLRVAKRWIEGGDQVAALTRSDTRASEFKRIGIEPILGDICEPDSLRSLPKASTILFAVGFDRNSGRSQHEVYVDGLRNVLEVVNSNCQHFIYISSSSVYGQSEGEVVNETSLCDPKQPGGVCCLTAEKLVWEYFRQTRHEPKTKPLASTPSSNVDTNGNSGDQVRSTQHVDDLGMHIDDAGRSHQGAISQRSPYANVLRLSGIYGPARLLTRVEALRAGQPISGRGDAWLNLIHVDDAASAVIACEKRGIAGETYLISDNKPVRREAYYSRLATLTQAPPPHFAEEIASKRGSGGLNKRCDNQKAREDLGLVLAFPSITSGLSHSLGLPTEVGSE